MLDVRLVLSDVDNTLTYENSSITAETASWVARVVRDLHIPFFIVSGRPRSGITAITRQIPAPVGICAFNGNYIEWRGGSVYAAPIDWDLASEVCAVSRAHGVDCVLFDLDDWYVQTGSPLYEVQKRFFGFDGTATDLTALLARWKREGHPCYKCIPKTTDPAKADMIEGVLKAHFGGRLSIYKSSPVVVEAMPPGANKGNAVRILTKYFGITPAQVMAFGDYDNDIEMIGQCGYGVAMGNAVEAVKRNAWYVTGTNKENGVASAIRTWLFPAG